MTVARVPSAQVADKRKRLLEQFLKDVLALPAKTSESPLVYTFFHVTERDEHDAHVRGKEATADDSQDELAGAEEPEICIKIKFVLPTLSIYVSHVRNLAPPSGVAAVDPYVKLYLLPDPGKVRRTHIDT